MRLQFPRQYNDNTRPHTRPQLPQECSTYRPTSRPLYSTRQLLYVSDGRLRTYRTYFRRRMVARWSGAIVGAGGGSCAFVCTSIVIVVMTFLLTFISSLLGPVRRGGVRLSGGGRMLTTLGVFRGSTRTTCTGCIGTSRLLSTRNGITTRANNFTMTGTTMNRRLPLCMYRIRNRAGCMMPLCNTNL